MNPSWFCMDCQLVGWSPYSRTMYYTLCSMKARMSSTRQAVVRSDSFTGFGNRPDFTPAHHVDFEIGMIVGMICDNRTKPVSGRVLRVLLVIIVTSIHWLPKMVITIQQGFFYDYGSKWGVNLIPNRQLQLGTLAFLKGLQEQKISVLERNILTSLPEIFLQTFRLFLGGNDLQTATTFLFS